MSLPDLGNDIVTRLHIGDEKSLQLLFDLHYKPLHYFAARLLKDRLSSDDVVEETFLKLWDRKTSFKTLQNIKAFLYITCRNACLNSIKQQQREARSKSQLSFLTSGQEDYVLNEMVRAEVMEEVTKEIDTLPVQCRKIFILSFVNGYKNQQIAEALKISVHTVKNQKIRAVQLLKIKLHNRNLTI
jgi:RNA polymerase sigma-70 factor (family 1)